MSHVPQRRLPRDLPTISLDQEKKPSTILARTGTEAYHHMAIPSPEPTSAMMTEPGGQRGEFLFLPGGLRSDWPDWLAVHVL
jgi:hypothetical protein